MTELEELRVAYAECSRQRNELLRKLKQQRAAPQAEPVAVTVAKAWGELAAACQRVQPGDDGQALRNAIDRLSDAIDGNTHPAPAQPQEGPAFATTLASSPNQDHKSMLPGLIP